MESLNEEYQELVYTIAYETIVEAYTRQGISEEEVIAILERSGSKKSNMGGTIRDIAKGLHGLYKATWGRNDDAIERYRNQKAAYENETDPKEKARLYRRMKNTSADHGVDDNSRKGTEQMVDAIGKGAKAVGHAVGKGVSVLKDKAKKAMQGRDDQPIGLSSLKKN